MESDVSLGAEPKLSDGFSLRTTFKSTGSLYIGRKIVLTLPATSPAETGEADGVGVGRGSMGMSKCGREAQEDRGVTRMRLDEAQTVVNEVCKEEYRLQSERVAAGDAKAVAAEPRSAAAFANSAAAASALLQQHLHKVSQQAMIQITAHLLSQVSCPCVCNIFCILHHFEC
jgi:hypothetical protein